MDRKPEHQPKSTSERYLLTDSEAASPEVREQYAAFLRRTSSYVVPHWLQCLGHSEALTLAFSQHVQGILLDGELPYVLKELVIFIVSVTNGSPYCSAAHAHSVLATTQSLRFSDLISLAVDIDSVQLPAAFKAAMQFAKKMAIDPASMNDADFSKLAQEGIDGPRVTELIAVICLAIMFNSMTTALQLPLDEGYLPVLPLPATSGT